MFVCLLVCFLVCCVCFFLFCKCHGIFSNPPRVLDLDDRQGLTASSAMQQKKNLFWFYPIYREMLNSASRHRPSKSMELRRVASGLVKVICRTEESRPGGKGLKPGKPKKKGLLASFGDWFGSINKMNMYSLYLVPSQLGSLCRRGHPEAKCDLSG